MSYWAELAQKFSFTCLKSNQFIDIFQFVCDLWQNDPVIPAFPDLHLSPAAILKELSIYFQRFSAQTRLLTLPAPHELPPRDAQEYPLHLFFIMTYCPPALSLSFALTIILTK
jgi:hypothetical protein